MAADVGKSWLAQSSRRTRASASLKVGNGFDFNGDKDGVWVEGTAQAALAYKLAGDERQSDQLLDGLKSDVSASGLLNATRSEKLSTGLSVDPTGRRSASP